MPCPLMSVLRKRSITISGHRTSITIEDIFWDTLKAIAKSRRVPMTKLIEEIDANRDGNLSSALRTYAMEETLKKRI